MRFGQAGFVVYEKKMGRLLESDGHPTALYASFHGTTRGCGNNVMSCVEHRAQAAPSMEAYGRRERLWRCTEERCVARMHSGDSIGANNINQTQKQQIALWKA